MLSDLYLLTQMENLNFHTNVFRFLAIKLPLKLEYDAPSSSISKPDYVKNTYICTLDYEDLFWLRFHD